MVGKIIINGDFIFYEFDFHAQIAAQLCVEATYGGNLDALWDLLSSNIERPVELLWMSSKKSALVLGDSFDDIVDTLQRVVDQDAGFGWDDGFKFALL